MSHVNILFKKKEVGMLLRKKCRGLLFLSLRLIGRRDGFNGPDRNGFMRLCLTPSKLKMSPKKWRSEDVEGGALQVKRSRA